MNDIFYQLAAVLGLSSLFGFLIRKFNLPLLIGYLFVGVLISASTAYSFQNSPVGSLPFIGIAFVLFLIGMELDFREIKYLGKPILITCFTQVLISAIAGISLATLFGFRGYEAQYLGVGLSFSSTVVIVKLLLEKKGLTSLYGKLALGVTLMEDIAALLILMYLSLSSSGLHANMQDSLLLASVVVKGLLLLLANFLFARFVLKGVFDAVARNSELLFLTALTWCFVSISMALLMGFSIIIGAFLAGLVLASSPFHYHISSKIKPLRDFFIVLFFVYLGTQVGVGSIIGNVKLIIIFTLYALLIKPFIFMLLFGSFGFRKHTIFQAAINLTQISEFSLIILLTGVQAGVVGRSALAVMGMTVAASITLSSIMITHSKKLYVLLRKYLGFFETKDRLNNLEKREDKEIEDHIIVIGANRVGGPIVDYLFQTKIPFVVLDFNPQIVKGLLENGIDAIYGDLGDPDVLDNLHLEKAKLIISTATDESDSKVLLSELKRRKINAKVVVRVSEDGQEKELKKKGADYVISPESVSADFLVNQLKHHWPNVNFTNL